MPVFVDTWGWVALREESDEAHDSVEQFVWDAFDRRERFVTSNFVLGETITFVFGRHGGIEGERILDDLLTMLKPPEFAVADVTAERFRRAVQFRRRYRDKPDISFTDLTSMVVMRELGITDILTADQHFLQVNLGFRIVPQSRERKR